MSRAIGAQKVIVEKKQQVLVFDHHPTISVLRSGGVDIADEVLNQGAEGLDMRQQTRRADNDR
jgi:hypothetical protein